MPSAWTTAVLFGSLCLRGATLLSTLALIYAQGPAEFAKAVPLLPLAPLALVLAAVGQDQAAFRRLVRREVGVSQGTMQGALIVAATGLALVAAGALPVALAFDLPVSDVAMSAGGGVGLAISSATSIAVARARQDPRLLLSSSVAVLLTTLLSRGVLLLAGAEATRIWAVGDLAGGVVAAGIGLSVATRGAPTVCVSSLKADMRYGLPLVPHGLAQWALGNADRWVLAGRVPPTALALYAAAYQFANVTNLLMSELNKARQHLVVVAGEALEVARHERKRLLFIVACGSLVSASAAALLIPPNRFEAAALALSLSLSYASLALYLPRANDVGLRQGRTHQLAVASFVGATANVAVNIALVGALGVWAGAAANAAGFYVMYLVVSKGDRLA